MAPSPDANESSIKLPGLGLAFNHMPDDHFPLATLDWAQAWPHTSRERCMVAFMEEVTLKEDWASQVVDQEVVAGWKAEVLARDWHQGARIPHGEFTETMFEYCIEELREKAQLYEKTSIVPILDITARLARSDRVISPDLQNLLLKAVNTLEQTASQGPVWNPGVKTNQRLFKDPIDPTPGDNNVAVNIIDPALHPLMYGYSKVLPDNEIRLHDCLSHIGKGVTVNRPELHQRTGHTYTGFGLIWSNESQWLPCNVEFSDGINAKITSYVNHLHPEVHADVYPLLEQVITKVMPLWNLVYSTIYKDSMPCSMRIKCQEVYRKYPNTPPYDPLGLREDLFNGLIDDDEWQRRTNEWLHNYSFILKPEPELKEGRRVGAKGKSVTAESIADNTAFLGDAGGIQVIVKLRALYPTPDNPVCDTENDWTLDGVQNDHICATAVYYFDDENVTDAQISFRSKFEGLSFEEDCIYDMGDSKDVEEIFGFSNGSPSVQVIGSVTMREGLVLAYPNVLQHKGSSFQLKDPTKPGHRKVLTLHLVDPRVKVLSTANVPPQQADWWARGFLSKGGQMKGLPKEVVDMVLDNVSEYPIPWKGARSLRDSMLEERGWLSRHVNQELISYRMNVDGNYFGDSSGDSDRE